MPPLDPPMPYGVIFCDQGKLCRRFLDTPVPVAVADPGFSPGGAPTPKIAIIFHIFAENCMKMKEFGPPGGGGASLAPPLDPPMSWIPLYQLAPCFDLLLFAFGGMVSKFIISKVSHP